MLCGVLCIPGLAWAEGPAEQPHAQSPPSPLETRTAIEQHLQSAQELFTKSRYEEAQAEFRAVLELDATHPEALRGMTRAQDQLTAQRADQEQARVRLRDHAQELAIQFAREKAQARARQQASAREQVALAREQQLKLLYNRGLDFYRQGEYKSAIDTLQQMVLVDPAHPLVRQAQRVIARADAKQAEARARVSARLSPAHGAAVISELEQQLIAKRIEVETVLKYAQIAAKERNYQMAAQLLQRALAQDPLNRKAQALLDQVQLARLKEDEARLAKRVEQDEQGMVNDVVRAQLLPPVQVHLVAPPAPKAAQDVMAAKLREPVSLDFADVPLSDVLEFLADAANVSIIPSPQLDLKTRRVSLKVSQLPLALALKYLVKNQSLAYRVDQDAVLIATPEEFSNEPMETRVFFLRSGLSPFTLETAAVEPNPVIVMESIKELVEQAIPQPSQSKLVVDERSGALIVTNTAEHLGMVERLLGQLDTTPVQVLIESRFVELTLTDLEHLGFESVLTGASTLEKKEAGDGTQGVGHGLASSGGLKFPALSRESEGLNLTLQGILTGTQFESVLHLLEESKKSKTLSAPRVTALNNQTAIIRVVEEFNYPTRFEVSLIQFDSNGDGDFDDAGETEFANVPKDFKKRDVGILLNVTPSVGKDLKTVTLVLAPEVSQFSQFKSLGGGVTVPEFTSSQLTTSVVIEDGQTIVLGGLMKDTTTETQTKVPVLGDLPLIGGLFRQTEATSTRKNLLIFITARLLAPRGPTT